MSIETTSTPDEPNTSTSFVAPVASMQARSYLSAAEVFAGARQPRGRNDLHKALTRNDNASVAHLIESGDAVLLNQQSRTGCTPLMLLAMGHCDEALLWRLIERSGAASVAVRSETRRSAADYAEEVESKRSLGVVSALRALEAKEVERTAQYRCPVCGDLIKKRPLLSSFWERAERGREDNVLLQRFFSTDCYRTLLHPRFHQINDARQIRKELTESVAILSALEAELPPFGCAYHVVDLCCGKSITAALLAMRYPGVTVSAIDKLEPRFVAHSNCDNKCGVHYSQLDVMSDHFVASLEYSVQQIGRPTVLLGMHLCGNLSVRAIQAFEQIEAISAVVLSPCCLPGKGSKESPPHLFFTKDAAEQYQLWAQHLEDLLREAVPSARVTRGSVEDILSPKNNVMCAVRSSGDAES